LALDLFFGVFAGDAISVNSGRWNRYQLIIGAQTRKYDLFIHANSNVVQS